MWNGKATVGLCLLLLVALLASSSNKESGSMTSLIKLMWLHIGKQGKQMKIVHYKGTKPPLNLVEDNKPPLRVAAISHLTLPFCISLCSVDLFCSVVEAGLVTELDDDEGLGKSL